MGAGKKLGKSTAEMALVSGKMTQMAGVTWVGVEIYF